MAAVVNPDATVIPDGAEVWLALQANVPDITTMVPTTPTSDPAALGWEFSGYIDDKNGIQLTPAIEVKPYDAFGHPRFRVKLRKGTLTSGFTVLEFNSVTKKIVLPGSTANKLGIPKNVQVYVLYKFVDSDTTGGTRVWVSLTPAPVETKNHGGVIDGELSFAELVVHHTTDANNDVFQVVDASADDVVKTFTIAPAVTTYTVTVGASTTAPIATKTATALEAALRLLPSVIALPNPDVTVVGPTGGPLVATFTSAPGVVSATGSGGTVTVT